MQKRQETPLFSREMEGLSLSRSYTLHKHVGEKTYTRTLIMSVTLNCVVISSSATSKARIKVC